MHKSYCIKLYKNKLFTLYTLLIHYLHYIYIKNICAIYIYGTVGIK